MMPMQPGAQLGANRQLSAQSAARPNATSQAKAQKIAAARARGLNYIPGEYVVKFKPGASAQAAFSQSGVRSMGLTPTKAIGNPAMGMALVSVSGARAASTNDQQALAALRSNPAIEFAEPNFIMTLDRPIPATNEPTPASPPDAFTPNDPLNDKVYGLKLTQAPQGWAIERGKPNTVIAIVDTGVDPNHPDLAPKLLKGYDVVKDSSEMADPQGHGTHCAGTAAAATNNGIGIAGFAPDVKILPVRVLGDDGSGSYADVANGIIWAADNGANVISMSLGGPSNSAVITNAVKHALSKGAMLIAASGNDGNASLSYPAAIPGVMAIGASDANDKIARFSQFGKHLSVAAPGVNIMSTFPTHASGMPGKDYGAISGTSMATPAAAGLAALVRSKYPNLSAAAVEAHIEATADDKGTPGFDNYFGHGRINVYKALSTPPAGR
jgi:thermitase